MSPRKLTPVRDLCFSGEVCRKQNVKFCAGIWRCGERRELRDTCCERTRFALPLFILAASGFLFLRLRPGVGRYLHAFVSSTRVDRNYVIRTFDRLFSVLAMIVNAICCLLRCVFHGIWMWMPWVGLAQKDKKQRGLVHYSRWNCPPLHSSGATSAIVSVKSQ